MKKLFLTLITCLILGTTQSFSQEIDVIVREIDSIHYKSNPRQTELDSLELKFIKSLNKMYDSGYTVSTNEIKNPVLYYLNKKGDTIPFEKYLTKNIPNNSKPFKAYFEVNIDWCGEIKRVKMLKSIGDINNIDFYKLWEFVKAKPSLEFNIPINSTIRIPIIKN